MAVAHIIIEIQESPDQTDCMVNMTYSGGSELTMEKSQAVFSGLLERIASMSNDEVEKNGL